MFAGKCLSQHNMLKRLLVLHLIVFVHLWVYSLSHFSVILIHMYFVKFNMTFLKLFLAVLVPLHFHTNFRISLLISSKIWWYFHHGFVDSVDEYGKNRHINNIKCSNLWFVYTFYFISFIIIEVYILLYSYLCVSCL